MGMLNEAEWLTRKRRLDTRLSALTPPGKNIRYHEGLKLSALDGVAVEELPTAHGPAGCTFVVNGVSGMRGGKAKASKVFGDLSQVVSEWNETAAIPTWQATCSSLDREMKPASKIDIKHPVDPSGRSSYSLPVRKSSSALAFTLQRSF